MRVVAGGDEKRPATWVPTPLRATGFGAASGGQGLERMPARIDDTGGAATLSGQAESEAQAYLASLAPGAGRC